MRNVLVVQPTPEFIEEVGAVVGKMSSGARIFSVGQEQLRARLQQASKPDLVILPLVSNSGISDWSALSALNANTPEIPVIVVLKPESEKHAGEAISRGASDVVTHSRSFHAMLPVAIDRAVAFSELRRNIAKQEAELARCRDEQRAKREFLSTITHELRTPLVGMRIYTQFLASGRMGPLAPVQKEKIECIYRNTERLTRCIESIQRYQRLETPLVDVLPVDFDLRSVLGEAISSVMPACMEKGITLGQSWPADPVNVHADRELILEVIKDLLDNAVKFTEAKGSISVNVVEAQGRQVVISILDSGCGIAKEMQEHLFETKKPDKKCHPSSGLGLGLRMVKRILEAHKSALQMDSVVGVGTRVRFALPPAQTMSVPAHDPNATRIMRRRQVLVVDDDEDNLACTRSVLEYAGYEVLGASSFDEAKVQLDEGHVDAILLDIAMRGADGMETLHSLKRCAATSSLPVVMVSAQSDDEVRVRASRMGAAGFVVKPFVPAKLLRELDSVMEAATV
jgi:signal transduction histidine kinase/ActR/RegA family two-component response regulator